MATFLFFKMIESIEPPVNDRLIEISTTDMQYLTVTEASGAFQDIYGDDAKAFVVKQTENEEKEKNVLCVRDQDSNNIRAFLYWHDAEVKPPHTKVWGFLYFFS
jgi:hypothetical protein